MNEKVDSFRCASCHAWTTCGPNYKAVEVRELQDHGMTFWICQDCQKHHGVEVSMFASSVSEKIHGFIVEIEKKMRAANPSYESLH